MIERTGDTETPRPLYISAVSLDSPPQIKHLYEQTILKNV